MLYRKAYDRLLEWKGQPKRKALCIMGARQIGKTTVIRQFGKEQYSCFVEINFITDTDATKIFTGNLDAAPMCGVQETIGWQYSAWFFAGSSA